MSPFDPNIELVEVWVAHGEIDAQRIRSILDAAGIDSTVRGESTRITHGLTVDGLAEARIVVRKSDAERARKLIEEHESGQNR